MKKFIYTLLAATALFTSCSNDSDSIIDNNVDNKVKTYDVKFAIDNSGIDFNAKPLTKSTSSTIAADIVVYKESGEVYSVYGRSPYGPDSTNYLTEDKDNYGKYLLSMKLPEGKYHVALAFYQEGFTFTPNNYFTDRIINYPPTGLIGRHDNMFLYYKSIDLNIPLESTTEAIPVVLKPMWSNINITLDVKDLVLPENTYSVICSFNPLYRSLEIKTETAPIPTLESSYRQNILIKIKDAIASGENSLDLYQIWTSKTSPENNNMVFTVEYLTKDSTILLRQDYDLKTQLENGYNYKIKGKLTTDLRNQEMSISLGEFNKEDTVIEF